jgi:hypothetical protein
MVTLRSHFLQIDSLKYKLIIEVKTANNLIDLDSPDTIRYLMHSGCKDRAHVLVVLFRYFYQFLTLFCRTDWVRVEVPIRSEKEKQVLERSH